MKICGKCKEEKSTEEFSSNPTKPDGLNWQCKDCHKEYRRQYYLDNRQETIDRVAKRRQEIREKVWEVKEQSQCIDCGENDPRVLEFDHVEGEKKFHISVGAAQGYGWETLLDEIDKCEIVCKNCHAVRTWERAGWKDNYVVEDH